MFFFFLLQRAISLLVKHSADVNARDKNWQTPLHAAAANRATKCAETLMALVKNVNIADRTGRTVLHHAVLGGSVEVCILLLRLVSDINLLHCTSSAEKSQYYVFVILDFCRSS